MKQRPLSLIYTSSDFKKSYRSLPKNIKEQFEKKDQWFRNNAFDPRLKTHQLKGSLNGYWAYSITYHYRVLFRFIKSDEAIYYDVGTHAIYR